jgi:hypothetical protein
MTASLRGDGTPRAPLSVNRRMHMPIKWTHDIDQALSESRTRKRPVLLDFTAAPM